MVSMRDKQTTTREATVKVRFFYNVMVEYQCGRDRKFWHGYFLEPPTPESVQAAIEQKHGREHDAAALCARFAYFNVPDLHQALCRNRLTDTNGCWLANVTITAREIFCQPPNAKHCQRPFTVKGCLTGRITNEAA
jgi:hypothetical protein